MAMEAPGVGNHNPSEMIQLCSGLSCSQVSEMMCLQQLEQTPVRPEPAANGVGMEFTHKNKENSVLNIHNTSHYHNIPQIYPLAIEHSY